MTCFWVILVVGVVFVIIGAISEASRSQAQKQKQEDQAKWTNAYKDALYILRVDPCNPQLREIALFTGRRYYASCREDKQVTVYDEMAIQNDISAVVANASTAPILSIKSGETETEGKLRTLQGLLENGLITNEEYQARRQKILDSIYQSLFLPHLTLRSLLSLSSRQIRFGRRATA